LRQNRLPERLALVGDRRDALRHLLGEVIPPGSRFVWEIGSGHGHFLTAYAKAHPERLCMGIDIASDRIARAERKRERAGLANLHFIRADAEDFLASMPGDARFASIFILFPDPWPKRRHHKNRVVRPDFLSAAAARSEKGAGLYFRTDHEPYFREVEAMLGAHPGWSEPAPSAWPFEEATVFQKRAQGHFSLEAVRR
jgi:tRNA (guanine-N7-)-methyltransferase